MTLGAGDGRAGGGDADTHRGLPCAYEAVLSPFPPETRRTFNRGRSCTTRDLDPGGNGEGPRDGPFDVIEEHERIVRSKSESARRGRGRERLLSQDLRRRQDFSFPLLIILPHVAGESIGDDV